MNSLLSRRALLLAGGALAVSAYTVFAADPSAKEFVENIYKAYVSKGGKGGNGVSIGSDAAIRRYFSPAVAALIIADARQAKKRDDVPALDGDPFVGYQDWEITAATVDIVESGATARGTVTLTNMGKPEKVSLALVKTPNGWRIDDVIWTEGSLRGVYKSR
jgi:hypothetical protein